MPEITSSPLVSGPTDSLTSTSLKQALERVRPELEAMAADSVLDTPGLDGSGAASIVIGALPRIAAFRAALVAQYGEEGERFLNTLPVCAYAVEQANVEVAAAESDSDLRLANDELLEALALLETDLDGAANRKLLDRSRIEPGRSKQGYRTVVMSTLVLVSVAREFWPTIERRVPITQAEVDRAEALAQAQLKRLNEREQGVSRMTVMEVRRRAISLLIKTYGEVRRMITYVRWWEGDADVIAPSLWSGRRRRNPREEDGPPVTPVVGSPVAPSPSPGPVDTEGPFVNG